MVTAMAQIRGSAAPATARRSAVSPGARLHRFAPLATAAVPAPLRRGAFRSLAADVASKNQGMMVHLLGPNGLGKILSA
ncbi:hypothetical protein PR202_gb17130 [Eleusine coracana subsp. coracana]|uniref:Uncharacterized protein n=1 Tax=Eleusine coracana subsp. coracana TaxID=191504 RepID=A0AAV5F1M5_ELECO|nr:hypothetical protein PR202_gb17130 [Eleusine coracana subsp. coracana]